MAHQAVSIAWDTDLVPTVSGRMKAPMPDCPVELALTAISGRLTKLVLRNLMSDDAYSYTDLANSLPRLGDKVQTERLHELVSAGLVARTTTTGFPQRTDYRITERGRELRTLLVELHRAGLELQSHDSTTD